MKNFLKTIADKLNICESNLISNYINLKLILNL